MGAFDELQAAADEDSPDESGAHVKPKSVLDELDAPDESSTPDEGPELELGQEFAKAFEAKDYKGIYEAIAKIAAQG